MPSFKTLAVGILASMVGLGAANGFLRADGRVLEDRMNLRDVEATLLSELAAALDQGRGRDRLSNLQTALLPMYRALPKNEHGNLDHAVVRYALHRYFVQRHGWFVKGLDSAGGTWNTSSPTEIVKSRVPAYIEALFEDRLGVRGFGIHELSVLAATLEHLIHDEAMGRLSGAYAALGLALDGRSSAKDAEHAIDAYMMVYVLGGNLTEMSRGDVERGLEEVKELYPGWDDIQMWVRDVRRAVEFNNPGRYNPFLSNELSFRDTAEVIEEAGNQFGKVQNHECLALKESLLRNEHGNSGRVRLSDFYGRALAGDWQFSESVEYLRELGALDETDPVRPSVVVANYVSSASNCIASSSFYSVCCINECEGLMGHLERNIAKSEAEPEQIAALVSGLPSDTVDAPRNLSEPLLRRLHEIAEAHGGSVPLHGRLFGQWMHHAYPRECPFPHVAGTTAPRTPDEWMAETGRNTTEASKEDMERLAGIAPEPDAAHTTVLGGSGDALPWSHVEELLVVRRPSSEKPGTARSFLRNLACGVALISMALGLAETARSALAAMRPEDVKMDRYCV